MHRTQITLTDAQYARVREKSARTGHSIAELIRRSLDAHFEPLPAEERMRLLESSFGAWGARDEGGREFVERVRSGTRNRVRRDGDE